MKHFYKRINRGIVLGVVLLIGLAVFIWQDEANFQKQSPVIQQTVTSYMETVGKINTFDTDLQKIGAVMTKTRQDEKKQEFTKTIDQYWAESNTKNGFSKSFLLEQLEDMVTQNSKGKGYIQKFSAKLTGTPSIKKTGPGSALANAHYTVVIEYAGSPMFFLGQYVDTVSHFSGMGKDGSSGSTDDTSLKRFTLDIQTDAELENIDGTWKITSINGGYGTNGQPVTITME